MKTSDVARIIIKAVYDQVLNCIRYDLHCLDPPCITSGMLEKYGFNSYVRKMSFWRSIDEIAARFNNIVVFKGKFGLFKLILSHDVEEVYRIEDGDVYVDVLDCNYIKCSITPRSHVLRIYLEGVYGGRVILRINLVTLLKMAIAENPYFRECLDKFVGNPLEPRSILYVAQCALSIITRHRSIYKLLFDKRSANTLDILRHSPILREYIKAVDKAS